MKISFCYIICPTYLDWLEFGIAGIHFHEHGVKLKDSAMRQL